MAGEIRNILNHTYTKNHILWMALYCNCVKVQFYS